MKRVVVQERVKTPDRKLTHTRRINIVDTSSSETVAALKLFSLDMCID